MNPADTGRPITRIATAATTHDSARHTWIQDVGHRARAAWGLGAVFLALRRMRFQPGPGPQIGLAHAQDPRLLSRYAHQQPSTIIVANGCGNWDTLPRSLVCSLTISSPRHKPLPTTIVTVEWNVLVWASPMPRPHPMHRTPPPASRAPRVTAPRGVHLVRR